MKPVYTVKIEYYPDKAHPDEPGQTLEHSCSSKATAEAMVQRLAPHPDVKEVKYITKK